jgi:hypothetical protein
VPGNLESLCDLVERRAGKYNIPLARPWERVFAAIRDGKMDFGFPDEFKSEYGGRNPPPPSVTQIREVQCVSALFAIKNGDAFDPWKQLWVQKMLVSPAAFDNTLFPADQKRRTGPKSLVNALVDFIKKTFPGAVPPGCTRKRIAKMAEHHVGGVVSERTVSRAIKKLKSDGTN